MKRPLQLSLAIALALGGTNALALGLGPVRVYSKLNQPLNAEIPIIQGSAGEAEGLLVNLAHAEDFERIGLNRSRLHVPLEFAVAKDAQGAMVIKVTSKDPVRESYLDFLIEANWPKGRLLREYTMLLDPPLTAPTRATATTAAPAAPARSAATTQPMREAAPAPLAAAPAPRASARSAPAAPAAKTSEGEYGPVAAGETLSAIARSVDAGANVNQMMLALLKSNPDAFYKGNINALKRGAILRIPGAEELKAAGSASAAAAAVHAQIEDWRGGKASPTLVADAGARAPAAAAAAAAKPGKGSTAGARSDDQHLELVPPTAGKDSLAMADRPGNGAGSAAASSELKSDLARTREALTAREQETGELKSQVKQLEGLKAKNDRLISLKDSEIAELQQKLKKLQAASAVAPVAPVAKVAPTAPVAAAPAPAAKEPIGKNEIWGQAAASAEGAEPAAAKSPASADAPAAAVALSPSTPAVTPSSVPAATPEALVAKDPAAAPAQDVAATVVTPAAAPIAASTTPAQTIALAEPAKSNVAPVAAKPAAAMVEPWYAAAWVKPAALGAGALLVLLGLLGLRRRKAVPESDRGSIADSFGDSPLGSTGAASTFDGDEQELLTQLQDDPENAGLHLELLSVYYAKRDVGNFEETAARMHAHVTDPHQAEWLEAQAMGQELAPHNPLFADAAHYDASDADTATAHADGDQPTAFAQPYDAPDDDAPGEAHDDLTAERSRDDAIHDTPTAMPSYDALQDAPALHAQHDELLAGSELAFGLGSDEFADMSATLPPPVPAATSTSGFDFDDLPPLEFDTSPAAAPLSDESASRATAAPVSDLDLDIDLDDGYFAGEDAIATKLDLAKAYMDMGDPDGARSMLEEVLAEGSDEQRAEAHRLMAEMG